MIWMLIRDIRNDARKCGEEDRAETQWSHAVTRLLIKYALIYTPWEDRAEVQVM